MMMRRSVSHQYCSESKARSQSQSQNFYTHSHTHTHSVHTVSKVNQQKPLAVG